MRIGYYIPAWPPGTVPNGIVTTLGVIGRQLREMGHEVFYITPHFEGGTQDQWVTVLDPFKDSSIVEKLHFKWNFEKAYFRGYSNGIADAVEKLVRSNGLEIFQMEVTHGWARTVIRRVPIPVIVKLDGPWFLNGPMYPLDIPKPENRSRIKREGEALRDAAGVLAPSNNVLNLSTAFYGRLKCPTEVIPNPYPAGSGARWSLDSCDRNLILFVGRFDRIKGADILLRAFSTIARKRSAIRLLFVGPDLGLSLDGSQNVSFAEFVDREVPLAVRDRIEYRGVLPQHEIEKLRVQSYLTIVCSRYETFGNTVVEALGVGCPTVATKTGGIPEILFDNRNGLLVSVEDVDGLEAAIAKLLDDPALALRLGEQAVHDCRDWFEPMKAAQWALDFYSKVIACY